MEIYEHTDYKTFLRDLIQSFPRKGHGQARRLAEHLSVNSVVISQILSGARHFSAEQGLQVATYFGLDERATEYLVNLIQRDRAGTADLKKYYEKKLETARAESLQLKNRVVEYKEISDADKGVFYSNWFYSGIRMLTSIDGYDSIEAIASYFGMSRARVAEVVEFLVSRGLCKVEEGRIRMGVATTFIDASSRYINNHRRNWRLKGLERLTELGPNDYFYSSVYSLSEADMQAIRKELAELIQRNSRRVADSPSEKVACINIDWFEF